MTTWEIIGAIAFVVIGLPLGIMICGGSLEMMYWNPADRYKWEEETETRKENHK